MEKHTPTPTPWEVTGSKEEMLVALKQAQAKIHATLKSLGLAKDGDVEKVFQTVSQAIARAEGK